MTKVKSVMRDGVHSSNYTAMDENYRPIEGVAIFHTYKTFATAVVYITTDAHCMLTTQQQDGIARRMDPRFRLTSSGIEVDRINSKGNRIFRRYTFPQ